MNALPDFTVAVCHDAGAANIIIETLRAASVGKHVRALMSGPAAEIWRREPVPGVILVASLPEALVHAHFVLTGTGWASSLEHDARAVARARAIPQAAVIDHWVNYGERFERHGVRVMPDEIWVTDTDAVIEAHRVFPSHPVRQIPNFYLRRTMAAISPVPSQARVLYLLEPLRYTWPNLNQPGEFEALDFFMRNLDALGLQGVALRLRAHPSDPPGKYDRWLHDHGNSAQMDNSGSLTEALSWASWAAGCESMALTVALAAGRKVVSTLPPGAPICRLPQAGILHLREMPGVVA